MGSDVGVAKQHVESVFYFQIDQPAPITCLCRDLPAQRTRAELCRMTCPDDCSDLVNFAAPAELDGNYWLLGPVATRWLAEVRESAEPVHRLTARLRKELSAEQTHQVLELADLRRRARAKFVAADTMLFTRQGFEQATDRWIARYKAIRFSGYESAADLCCGMGGDTAALAQVGKKLVACDRSGQAVAYATHNLQAMIGEAAQRVEFVTGDVESLDLANFCAWHIDPDRRPRGRRTVEVAQHEPSEEVLERLLEKNPHAAIKLAPACEPPARWEATGELEWISRGGECRQLVAWLGNLAQSPGQRRATVVAAEGDAPVVVRTLVGDPATTPDYGEQVEQYVYEPDPAILASELAGCLAREQGWATFASTIGYLTGSKLVDEPACQRFAVDEVMPMKIKRVASYLKERRIGRLEIKHRAVELSPDRLRRELKLSGDQSATLLVTRVGEKRIAIVAQRIPLE